MSISEEEAPTVQTPAVSDTQQMPAATSQPPASPPSPNGGHPPTLADDVELIGEMEGSGYKDAPSLVRRADGQVIQLPSLLYSVAAKADGKHTFDEIAAELTEEIKRGVDGDNVKFLVEEKLRPMGVLAQADGSSPSSEQADPFLALKFRATVVPDSASNAVGTAFKPLFFPPVVLAVLGAFVAFDIWLFFVHGVAQSIRQSIYHPGLFLPLFAAVILSAAFHEIGHAAGCRYGGGEPGKMGCGLYLAWPAFYTDVTDAYRLNKRGRLRTDLGGVYFNVIVVLLCAGAYLLTHFEPLLLLIIIQHFEIAHQLLPIVRLDGYYIVADATGVPDLFARIGPILASLLPWRETDDRVTALKRWVRAAVTAWVLIVVPLLLFELLVLLVHLPRILGTAWDSGVKQYHAAQHAFDDGNPVKGITAGVQMVVLAIPVAGIVLMLARTGRQAASAIWSRTTGKPAIRALALGLSVVCGALLLRAWIPGRNYEPIRPGEHGTITQGIRAVRQLPRANAPLDAGVTGPQQSDEPTTPASESPSTTAVAPTQTTIANDVTETTIRRQRSGGTTANSTPVTTPDTVPADSGAPPEPQPQSVP
jgi:putative peptide zinc metalloprotease protein